LKTRHSARFKGRGKDRNDQKSVREKQVTQLGGQPITASGQNNGGSSEVQKTDSADFGLRVHLVRMEDGPGSDRYCDKRTGGDLALQLDSGRSTPGRGDQYRVVGGKKK